MSTVRTILLVTGNAKKVEEIQSFVKENYPIKVATINIDLPELQGNIDEITINKCQEAAKRVQAPVLVEDTSLGFNALGGLPGPYIKWFEQKLGPEGLIRLLSGWEDKTAEAICTFAYSSGDSNNIILFQGSTKGKIVPPRGRRDFGWDCIFQPDGSEFTYGEMTIEKKNLVSHRRKPLEDIKDFFATNF